MLDHLAETLRPALPTDTPWPPIEIEPSARALLVPWLLERTRTVIRLVVAEAQARRMQLVAITLSGFTSSEEQTRELVVTCWLVATDVAAFDFWDAVAAQFAAVHHTSPPADATHADVRLAVEVRWDG